MDLDTWYVTWVAPCCFYGASPTGSPRWGNCLQRQLACKGLLFSWKRRYNIQKHLNSVYWVVSICKFTNVSCYNMSNVYKIIAFWSLANDQHSFWIRSLRLKKTTQLRKHTHAHHPSISVAIQIPLKVCSKLKFRIHSVPFIGSCYITMRPCHFNDIVWMVYP